MEPYYVIVQLLGQTVAIELMPERRDSDVWIDLDAFDAREGTNLYDHIDNRNVLDVVTSLDRTPYTVTSIIRNAEDARYVLMA